MSTVIALAARDPKSLAGFYDEHAGRVKEYCTLICPSPLVDEATFVAFVDFLGRLGGANAEDDIDELLWKATRGAAAGRAEVRDAPTTKRRRSAKSDPGPICRAMPELLAAYASGELARNAQLDKHLLECSVCRTTAMRFRQAEAAFTAESEDLPPDEIRRVWLEIALSEPA